MAEEILGVDFDIHGGGNDLVFPHHENEAAQTRAARGKELARIWMHNGMLEMRGEKMAKSVGNISLLPDVVEAFGRDAVIMLFVSGHPRQPLLFSDETMQQAGANVRRIREAARRLEPGPSPAELEPLRERFFAALADDFGTPDALAAVFDWVREANRRADAGEAPGSDALREMLAVLGLENLLEPEAPGAADDAARELLRRREEARAAKDFAEADRLRDGLRDAGWDVRDGPEGPELVPVA
jgi:cysteinyl-tRNA synthetase